jgi:hypothetical protein
MSESGQLRNAIDNFGNYSFVRPDALRQVRNSRNWFVYSLLCSDIWFKLSIQKAKTGTVYGGDTAR